MTEGAKLWCFATQSKRYERRRVLRNGVEILQFSCYVLSGRPQTWFSPPKSRKVCSRIDQICKFLLEYVEVITVSKGDGDYVIVYMGETFCHQRHSSSWTGFARPTLKEKNLHAITDATMSSFAPSKHMTTLTVASKMILSWSTRKKMPSGSTLGRKKNEGLHKNMNIDNFMRWLEERLIPSFEAKVLGKKMACHCNSVHWIVVWVLIQPVLICSRVSSAVHMHKRALVVVLMVCTEEWISTSTRAAWTN